MPTVSTDQTSQIVAFFQQNGLLLLFWSIVLVVGYRVARPFIHRAVVRATKATASAQGGDELAELAAQEAAKRAATVEDLIAKSMRLMVVLIGILVVLSVFNLFGVIAGLGIVLAAITLAGQSIVLDYLMGVLILVEGQYYIGDTIAVGGIEGVVEEITLRRTVVRDASGTVHSISNGVIRTSSNLTRLYAGLNVDVVVPFDTDIEKASTVVDRVGREMYEDPTWSGRLIDVPQLVRVGPLGELGVTLKIGGRVRANDRWTAPGEFRRRLLVAFQSQGIEIARRGAIVVGKDAGGQRLAVDPADLDAPPPAGPVPPAG